VRNLRPETRGAAPAGRRARSLLAVIAAVAAVVGSALLAAPGGPAVAGAGSTTTSSTSTTQPAAGGTATTTTAPGGAIPGATTVEFFEPWNGDRLWPALRVSGTLIGSCFAGSLAVNDPDAWRCLSGDRLLDPCFAPPESRLHELACGSPWSDITLLRLDAPLPRDAANHAAGPTAGWLLQLANGARCALSQGAAGKISGVEILYVCSRGAAAGPLRWSEEPWTVPYVTSSRRAPRQVAVSVAWGG
jgi:hypothetical protein